MTGKQNTGAMFVAGPTEKNKKQEQPIHHFYHFTFKNDHAILKLVLTLNILNMSVF